MNWLNKFKFVARLFTFLLLASPAFAADSFANSFLSYGLEIPTDLQRAGYSSFGDLNLSELISKMHQVQILKADTLTIARKNGNGRISARWERSASGTTISLNTKHLARFANEKPLLALHEYLGALGYDDENYHLSTEMWFLSQPDAQSLLRQSEKDQIVRRITQLSRVRYAGGVIGVGSGGEGATLWVRIRRLKKNLEELQNARHEGERDQVINQIPNNLEANVTASYEVPGMRTKAQERAMKKEFNKMVSNARCLVQSGTCPVKGNKFAPSCSCPGDDSIGVIIFPR